MLKFGGHMLHRGEPPSEVRRSINGNGRDSTKVSPSLSLCPNRNRLEIAHQFERSWKML